MGEANDHRAMRGWRYRKAMPIGDLTRDLLESLKPPEPDQQSPAQPQDRKESNSSSADKAQRGFVKVPRELRDVLKSPNKIRRISAAIEIHLRESVRWGPYVEHFRGPYGKPNKTKTNAGEVFVNISRDIESLAKEGIRVTPKQIRRRVDQLRECGVLTRPPVVPGNGGVIYKANFPDKQAALNSAKYAGKIPKGAKYAPQKGRSNEEGKDTDILVNNEAKGRSMQDKKGKVLTPKRAKYPAL